MHGLCICYQFENSRVRSNYGCSLGVSVLNKPCGNASFESYACWNDHKTNYGVYYSFVVCYCEVFPIIKKNNKQYDSVININILFNSISTLFLSHYRQHGVGFLSSGE